MSLKTYFREKKFKSFRIHVARGHFKRIQLMKLTERLLFVYKGLHALSEQLFISGSLVFLFPALIGSN